MTHICVSDPTSIGSDNGLSPGRRQAIIRTNAGILLKGPLGTNFSEILIEILSFSLKKIRLKMSSAKRRPFCLGLNVLKDPLKSSLPNGCWATHLNNLVTPERSEIIYKFIFLSRFQNWYLDHRFTYWDIGLRWMPQNSSAEILMLIRIMKIGSENGLVLAGNKLLSELILTQIYVIIWLD